jgi:electron transport complex protein RnfC
MGVSASRITSPDLIAQLHQAMRRPIDVVLCNLLDGDPNSCLNSAVAAAHPRSIVAGVLALARILGGQQACIVIEAGSPGGWWVEIRRLAREHGIRVIFVANDYPQSDPSLLLLTLFKRRLRPGRSPVEQGVLLLDGPAALATGEALLQKRKMTHMPLALRDHGRRQTHFFSAPVGTIMQDLLLTHGIDPTSMILRIGDVLRDRRAPGNAVVGGGELVVHLTRGRQLPISDPCIRCGWCVEMCPTRINPAAILEAAQRHNLAMGERYGLESCIECGICTYVCPSHLPLLEGIRALRALEV